MPLFSMAFDVVCHKRIIVKLEAIGVEEKALQWIADWLRNQQQRVGINGQFSDWVEVVSSVIQLSFLGGILFNIINL